MSEKPSEVSKGQFIRNHMHLTAKETIEKARAEGITLSPAVVYSTRSETKKKLAGNTATASPGILDRAKNDAVLRAKITSYGTMVVRALLDSIDRANPDTLMDELTQSAGFDPALIKRLISPENLAWLRHLPDSARAEFRIAFERCPADEREQLIREWRNTAEIYADPELFKSLSESLGTVYAVWAGDHLDSEHDTRDEAEQRIEELRALLSTDPSELRIEVEP